MLKGDFWTKLGDRLVEIVTPGYERFPRPVLRLECQILNLDPIKVVPDIVELVPSLAARPLILPGQMALITSRKEVRRLSADGPEELPVSILDFFEDVQQIKFFLDLLVESSAKGLGIYLVGSSISMDSFERKRWQSSVPEWGAAARIWRGQLRPAQQLLASLDGTI